MQKINEYVPLSDEEIAKLLNAIKEQHKKYLDNLGIKLPKDNTNKMYWLVYLTKYQGKLVHKDVITKFVQDKIPNVSGDQQVRHLSQQDGYNVLGKGEIINGEKIPSGYYILINLTEASHKYREGRRQELIGIKDWEELKKKFDYRCATCGAKEGSIHKVTGKEVKLQKGHMNPNEPLDVGNIIPQCNYCNGEYFKNDFVFNEFGYPQAINNPNYVLKSSEEVKKEMLDILKQSKKADTE